MTLDPDLTKKIREQLDLLKRGGPAVAALASLIDSITDEETSDDIVQLLRQRILIEREMGGTGLAFLRLIDRVKERIAALKLKQGEPGPAGETIVGPPGERGSKFLGSFKTTDNLPLAKNYLLGDYALVEDEGAIWYIV